VKKKVTLNSHQKNVVENIFSDTNDDENLEENNDENSSDDTKPSIFTQQRKKLMQKSMKKFTKSLFCCAEDDRIQCDVATKLTIVNKIKKINTSRTASFDKAKKNIQWDKLNILAYTEEELKIIFEEIVKDISKYRTLDEMLNDYLENYQKYELKKNINAPKMPMNPCMSFITANRDEIERKLKKKYPDVKIRLGDVSKFGAKMFQKLPEKEKELYKQQHKDKLEKYHAQKAMLLKLNPELQKKRKTSTVKNERKKAETKPDTYLTPFKLFYQDLRAENADIVRSEAQKMYKNLGDKEKLEYINKLFDLETELEKRFSADEKKIVKYSSGELRKPLSAYNLYVQDKSPLFSQLPSPGERMKKASIFIVFLRIP
jgi:HMG (high mobility group) box